MTNADQGRGDVRVWVFAALAIVAASGLVAGVATQPDQPDAESILDGVEQRYDGADSYTGVVVTEAVYDNDTERVERTSRVRVQYTAPDSHRVDVLAPDDADGTVAATNGSVAWTASQDGRTLVRPLNASQSEMLARANLSVALDRLQENATVTYDGTETRGGVETHVLDIVPDDESVDASATVWVGTDDYRLQAIETVAEHDDARVETTTRFESFTFGVDIHESTFRPPEDRGVVVPATETTSYDSLSAASEAVSVPVAEPSVPDRFALADVVVAEGGDDATVTATYEASEDSLAVVQSSRDLSSSLPSEVDTESVRVGDRTATYVSTDEFAAVYWTDDGTTTAVTGSVSEETLVSVAESVAE